MYNPITCKRKKSIFQSLGFGGLITLIYYFQFYSIKQDTLFFVLSWDIPGSAQGLFSGMFCSPCFDVNPIETYRMQNMYSSLGLSLFQLRHTTLFHMVILSQSKCFTKRLLLIFTKQIMLQLPLNI